MLELLFHPRSYPGQWKNSWDFVPSFSAPLLGQVRLHPFRLVLGGRGFHGRAGRGSTSFPGQQAKLCARVGLVALGSFWRRLGQPARRPWVCWGLLWVRGVWHLVVDPWIPWDQRLTLLNSRAHPARADLRVGAASTKQKPFKIRALLEGFPPFLWRKQRSLACRARGWCGHAVPLQLGLSSSDISAPSAPVAEQDVPRGALGCPQL